MKTMDLPLVHGIGSAYGKIQDIPIYMTTRSHLAIAQDDAIEKRHFVNS